MIITHQGTSYQIESESDLYRLLRQLICGRAA